MTDLKRKTTKNMGSGRARFSSVLFVAGRKMRGITSPWSKEVAAVTVTVS